jgi:uncharacterized membrane protein
LKSILEGKPEQFKNKKYVSWAAIALICVLFCVANILYFAVDGVGNSVFVIMNSVNLVVSFICSILVTHSVATISGIASKLPYHLKKDTNMIWSHLILFNLLTVFELALVITGWHDYRIRDNEALFMTTAFFGFCVQLLIAAVIVKFSNPSNKAKTNKVWTCALDYSSSRDTSWTESD